MSNSNKIQPYGLDLSRFPEIPNQLEIELLYVASQDSEGLGGLPRQQHLENCIKILFPWVWKFWHEWNEMCLSAWCNYDEIGVTGCASAHKTFTFTLLSFIEWLAKPMATSVILTSATIGSLRGKLWNEVVRFYNSASIEFGHNVIDSREKIQYKKGDDKYSIRAFAVDSGDVVQAIGKIQGVHPERMILMIDEATQTNPAIFMARANLRVGTTFYRCVTISNAFDLYDGQGRFCEPKGGYSTISVDDETWETKTGICLHLDGLKSPNVRRGKEIFPHLFSQRDVDLARKDFGENSLEWYFYVRGFPAPRGIRNTVLDASMILDGKAQEKAVWEGSPRNCWAALDPAFTTEGDDIILRFALAGNFFDGCSGIESTEIVKIQLVENKEYPLNYQIADRVIQECQDREIQAANLTVDSTNASGLCDIIEQRWGQQIRRVSFGGLPLEGQVSITDSRDAKKVYKNRVTQLWYNVNRLVAAGRIRGLDDDTCREFCIRQYILKNEVTTVESKKEMKKRTGGASPDRADAFALLVDKYVEEYGIQALQSGVAAGSEDSEWEQLANKYNLSASYANA